MNDIIFARPRHNYDSYTDLYSVITLSGFPLIFVDEIDPQSDNCYIVTILNGETEKGWPDARARIVLLDLEWHMDGLPAIPGVSEVWAGDAFYADKIGAKYVFLGSHPDLNFAPEEDADKCYDVAMLCYYTHRRQIIRDQLLEAGMIIAPNGWKWQRHDALITSKLMLNVHQRDDAPTIAPLRWMLAAAYKLPVISENVIDPGAIGRTHAMFCQYSYLPKFVKMWRDDRRLHDYAYALHDLMCLHRPFRKCIEAAL